MADKHYLALLLHFIYTSLLYEIYIPDVQSHNVFLGLCSCDELCFDLVKLVAKQPQFYLTDIRSLYGAK